MFLSIFDIFKIGIGPSSSHTMGPMSAAARFLEDLRETRRPGGREREPGAGDLAALRASLHGSLAFTGKGHATDRAVVLGFAGLTPDTLDPNVAETLEKEIAATRKVGPPDLPELAFSTPKTTHAEHGEFQMVAKFKHVVTVDVVGVADLCLFFSAG